MKKLVLVFSLVVFFTGCASSQARQQQTYVAPPLVVQCSQCWTRFTPPTDNTGTPWTQCPKCGANVLVPAENMRNSSSSQSYKSGGEEEVPFPHHLFNRPRGYSETESTRVRRGYTNESWGKNWYSSNYGWVNYSQRKTYRVRTYNTRKHYHWP
ncbi:MAG: hypothetical protein UU18_C0011G0020 [Parcubacteria group bacterium GW2011_GWB2_40_8]|nr:MAG: hypothetical protein UT71_C0002G0037 [Parcubacteria group bacterium GW2011_GWF2_40_10]KKR47814.1 MAG: hypothetical protein UT83_C0003G0027 [Parcubacteria group bacterium GW2011_GWA2_40_143]KKR60245.1 MAG: hypothetical protein UT97_C0003G0027 [Parcubacteria group bacterium GW2011_GWC2_40_31]KKR75215.1 MAG: hypothetical protein UU18_C0011G0020 [Parcubacteria group bacterium GW2011_GWB2_40_8]KKR77393.1 MAG: hypothetical protein UU20_C0008G0006 [Parcubacteria group bacterium GW2011_GWE2_40_